MKRLSRRARRAGVALVAATILGAAIGFGVAQSTVVTQAEWAVYLAQGLGLDWNLPRNAKSNHYLARLQWTRGIDFEASHMLEGSTALPSGNGSIEGRLDGPSEALYQVAMLRAGDYGFRIRLAGGGAMLKVGDRTYEVYQPTAESKWVDLDRVPLTPGSHTLSLMLTEGTRADALGVTPPCLLPVEPSKGWRPLEPLRFDEMAVTLAKALDLEASLPTMGEPIIIRGEEFLRTLVHPLENASQETTADPFWLSSEGAIVTAVARFEVREPGVYSIEPRYLSAQPVRWNLDSCLRVVTCPVTPNEVGRRRSLALELEAGLHEIEVTLAPGAKLDRVDVQRRDHSIDAYLDVVENEGFELGAAEETVLRKDAVSAARRLRDRFLRRASTRCEDSLIAMEAVARARALQSSSSSSGIPVGAGNAPGASAGPSQISFNGPVFPPVGGSDPRVATPVQPGQ